MSIRVDIDVVKSLPSNRPLVTGTIYKVEQPNGKLKVYTVNSNGEPIEETGLSVQQENKLDGLKTQSEITADIEDSKVEANEYTEEYTYSKVEVKEIAQKEALLFDTIADFRAMSAEKLAQLNNGKAFCATLLGYYTKGDTPAPIDYFISSTTSSDDGFSIIEVGSVKFEHKFVNELHLSYCGIKEGEVCNDILNKAFLYGSVNKIPVRNRKGTFLINGVAFNNRGVRVPSNITFLNDPNTFYKIQPNSSGNSDAFAFIEVNNIYIDFLNIIGEKNEHLMPNGATAIQRLNNQPLVAGDLVLVQSSAYRVTISGTTASTEPTHPASSIGTLFTDGTVTYKLEFTDLGEWGNGISIISSSNITISKYTASNCWGDGLYIGKRAERLHNYNILIDRVEIDGSRRNGISIINGKGVRIESGTIKNTFGTNPQRGMDIEPNHASDILQDIVINNIESENNLRGSFIVYLIKLDTTSSPVSVFINNIFSRNDGELLFSENHTTGKVNGFIEINNFTSYKSTMYGIRVANTCDTPRIIFNNPKIIDSKQTPIAITVGSPQVQLNNRQLYLDINNAKVYQYEENLVRPIVMFNSVAEDNNIIKGVNINGVQSNFLNRTISYLGEGYNFQDTCKFTKRVLLDGVNTLSKTDFAYTLESPVSSTTRCSVSIPKERWALNTPIEIINKSTSNGIGVRFFNGGYIAGFDNVESSQYQITSETLNASIELECVDNVNNVWKIVSCVGTWYLNQGSGNPAHIITSNSKPYQATSANMGVVKQSANVLNSTVADATDLTTALALVNDLKVKLNAKLTADRNSGQQSTT